jgi:hypothetical protein
MLETVMDAVVETDEEIMERLRERFEILEDMTMACKVGKVRSLIVSGAPGVGKSHGVQKVLAQYDTVARIAQDETLKKYEIVKGAIGALGLFMKLYEYRHENSVVVFDDSDDVFKDDRAINMLKSALDSNRKRMLSWHYESNALKDENIPNTFEFCGSVIFITNINFNHFRSKVLRSHLDALTDRSHFLDLTVHTTREKLLRIKQVVEDGMLDELKLSDHTKEEVVDFVCNNTSKLQLSLRSVVKTAELADAFPDDYKWKRVAKVTLMKG